MKTTELSQQEQVKTFGGEMPYHPDNPQSNPSYSDGAVDGTDGSGASDTGYVNVPYDGSDRGPVIRYE